MKCRNCQSELEHLFVDLGFAPPSNAYLNSESNLAPELCYPLRVYVCHNCWLVQTEDYTSAEDLFNNDYAYFSSISKSWLDHAGCYCKMITDRLNLTHESMVLEIASNDGYLLRNFVRAGIKCLGIEPTASTAEVAEKQGIPVRREFFSEELGGVLAEEGMRADLICGNNVYAHVPDINCFTKGLERALKNDGTINLEFPHLLRLLEYVQFDTIYHEHFSYLSLTAVDSIFKQNGLRIYDVEELPTHGGSLRIYGCKENSAHLERPAVAEILQQEEEFGITTLNIYKDFQKKADKVKDGLLLFLLEQKRAGKSVVGYGAAAKGNTLINYAGIGPDLLEYVCDASESKQGKFLPGSHIPIYAPEKLNETQPDWVVIFPWNIAKEVSEFQAHIKEWGGIFIVGCS